MDVLYEGTRESPILCRFDDARRLRARARSVTPGSTRFPAAALGSATRGSTPSRRAGRVGRAPLPATRPVRPGSALWAWRFSRCAQPPPPRLSGPSRPPPPRA